MFGQNFYGTLRSTRLSLRKDHLKEGHMSTKVKKQKRPVESSEQSLQSPRPAAKLTKRQFDDELEKLQVELVKLQFWVKQQGLKVVVLFEGRDAAGKGGVIKCITERVSPRVFHVVALSAPTEREKSQMYFQRYLVNMPAAGEVMLFDRSWYNRAGVEYVMGFCTEQEHKNFLRVCPETESAIIDSGIILIKYWFEVSQQEQERRFQSRIDDGRKVWKLSPMDVEAHRRWYDYSRARDEMLEATDTPQSPWNIVPADNKRSARLNCITHLLSQIPYKEIPSEPVVLPKRKPAKGYREPEHSYHIIPQIY